MSRHRISAALFASMLVFWLALSARFDPLFLGMGVASAAVVTLLMRDLVADVVGVGPARGRLPYRVWRAAVYVVWLIGRLFVASVQVAYLVLHPRVPVEPAVLRFATTLTHPVARTMLANSITLVPGTMTLQLEGSTYVVHALAPSSADDLVSGRMQSMIGALFLEGPEEAPEVTWERGVTP
jgi:multicomponent Na+:H+ antiporter subunit E